MYGAYVRKIGSVHGNSIQNAHFAAELCAEKGLDCAGLKKVQILALLKHTDVNAASDIVADAGDSAAESDVEVESNGAADDSVAAGESEKIIALRLKLQLMEAELVVIKHKEKLAETEWARERERMALLGAAGAASQSGTDAGRPSSSLRGHLPIRAMTISRFFMHLWFHGYIGSKSQNLVTAVNNVTMSVGRLQ